MSGLKYGLNVPKKSQNKAPKKALFDDDEELLKPPTGISKPSRPLSQYGSLSGQTKQTKSSAKVEELDPSIYDYDGAYDAMHAKSAAKIAAEKEDAKERKPKYMKNLIAAADVRERDQLRAKDKLLQKEREAEGDDFADKEKFVTDAYRKQQEDMRKLEEEEKRKEEEEAKKKRGKGMQGFYRSMIDQDEQRHKEIMEATNTAKETGTQAAEDSIKEKSDAEIAKELNAKGGNIIVNEEGQIADKRQLLKAGLNVTARPKPTGPSTGSSASGNGSGPVYKGRTAQQKAVRERQSKMLEEQLEQSAKRAADEEAEEQRKQEHAAKSRKTKEDINSVRERFLQRKRDMAAAKKES